MKKLSKKGIQKKHRKYLDDAMMTSIAGIAAAMKIQDKMTEIFIAFGAGLISFLSPCVCRSYQVIYLIYQVPL